MSYVITMINFSIPAVIATLLTAMTVVNSIMVAY